MDDCLNELLPCSSTLTGNLYLVFSYCIILAFGAKMIAHGSEILMEVLNPGIIGGFVLPVLGALPDAAIIFVSALGGDKEQVQYQLSVGMGTLAGSNVLLLTLPWAASLWLAKTDISTTNGKAKNKVYSKFSWTQTGVTVYTDVLMTARMMIITLTPYCVIQLSYIILRVQGASLASAERWWALGSFIFCCFLFLGYSIYQVLDVTMQQRRLDKAKEALMWKRLVKTLSNQVAEGGSTERWLLGYQMPHVLGVDPVVGSIKRRNNSHSKQYHKSTGSKKDHISTEDNSGGSESESEDSVLGLDEQDQSHNMSKEYEFPAPKAKHLIFLKAAFYLLVGTAIVLCFADPMVKSISALGDTIHLSPFYIAFIVTPAASNSSELFASYEFAKKKTKKTTSLIHAALYGAVAMNNTISLGVFLAMIFFRELKWNFSAETLVIAFVTISVGILASWKSTLKTYHVLWITALYPISILLVALLESSWIGWE